MNDKKLTTIVKEFALPLSILMVIFVSFFVIIVPKFRQISELKKEVEIQEKTISRLSQKVADLQTLSEADLFDSSTFLREALPGEKDFYRVMMMAKNVLSKNNVGLTSFKFSPGATASDEGKNSKASQGPQKMAINVSFSSSFENLKKMFIEVNNMLPLTDIESLQFGEIKEATDSGDFFDMDGKISLVSYWAPLPATLDKPEKPLVKISTEDKKLIEQLKSYSRFQDQSIAEEFSSGVVVGKDNPF
ncbi:MAG: hypothetical protein ACOX50_01840 [Patescibacteria group bacterium]|jgi:hypothetical protein